MEIEVDNISKTWRGFNLKNISLKVASGEYFILLGPTGAGKTLLLETIMGFHKPDVGRIILGGLDITGLPPEKRGIGYVPQTCVLFPHMNVRRNIEFGLKVQHVAEAKRKKIVDQVLESTGLISLASRQPVGLSGGEKQKVALARVLATQPKVMLLDEPLTGMDAETARDLRKELKQIHAEGTTVLHVTHSQIEGFSLGNRMGIIRAGELVQTGKTEEMMLNPQSAYVAKFLGYENVFHAFLVQSIDNSSIVRVEEVRIEVAGRLNSAECEIAIRPEDIEINPPQNANQKSNVLEAIVLDFVDQGHFVAVTLNAGVPLQTLLTRSAFMEKHLAIGQKVLLAFKPGAIHIIKQTG